MVAGIMVLAGAKATVLHKAEETVRRATSAFILKFIVRIKYEKDGLCVEITLSSRLQYLVILCQRSIKGTHHDTRSFAFGFQHFFDGLWIG